MQCCVHADRLPCASEARQLHHALTPRAILHMQTQDQSQTAEANGAGARGVSLVAGPSREAKQAATADRIDLLA